MADVNNIIHLNLLGVLCRSRSWSGFQIADYINGFIHPSDITVFAFDAQTGYLAFAAASYQISIVGGVKHNIIKRYFKI
jgi:hypothetical protein